MAANDKQNCQITLVLKCLGNRQRIYESLLSESINWRYQQTKKRKRLSIIGTAYLMKKEPDFTRERSGIYPNNFLNYGYAVLKQPLPVAWWLRAYCLPSEYIMAINTMPIVWQMISCSIPPFYVDHLVKEIINKYPKKKR